MSSINSFFTSANASLYVDTLFSAAKPSNPSSSSSSASGPRMPYGVDENGQTAGQRALSRIIDILTLGGDDASRSADIDEQIGYVTGGTGTEGDDKLTVTGRGIYNLDTGEGNDTLTLKSALISGVTTGNGDDTIKAAGSFIGSIDGGDGNDDIQLKAELALDIKGGAGDDTLKVSADTIVGLDGGEGNDSLTLEGNRIFATGGAGNDTVRITTSGTDALAEYGFTTGGGKDTVTSNGPLSLSLGGLSEADLAISVKDGALTASISGSGDTISVTIDEASSLTYSFTVKNGQTILSIR
jgi:hypothetical protein